MEKEKIFLTAEDISSVMGVSKSKAYKIINKLNEEFKEKGKMIIQGKVNRKYFEEKIYY